MSAKRFGGDFSPGGNPTPSGGGKPVNKFRGRKATSVDVRALLLFVLPTPILLAAFNAMGDGAPAATPYPLQALDQLPHFKPSSRKTRCHQCEHIAEARCWNAEPVPAPNSPASKA